MNRQAEISAESRERLLAAAWGLLAEGGSRAATVQAVADRSGISRGSIAWHFGSKESLIVAVVNSAFDMLTERLATAFRAPETEGWDAVLGAQSVVFGDERFRIFGTLALEASTEHGPLADAFAAGHRRIRDLYADYIKQHALAGDGVDPAELATALRALTLGLNIHRRFDGGVIPLLQAIDVLRSVDLPTTVANGAARTKGRAATRRRAAAPKTRA